MHELIQITTGGQGSPVVSARELYDYLSFDASQWARWSKKNIVGNPYAKPGEDWQELDSMSSKKSRTNSKDYVLTLDFAKRLSMLARTEKGEEIRRYFLACEEKAIHRSRDNELVNRIASLERLVSQMLDREQFRLDQDQPAAFPLAVETTRVKIAKLVSRYAEQTQELSTYHVWNRIWDRLHILYGFNVRIQRKTPYNNLLDVAERYGQLERIYKIVTDEFNSLEE